MSMSPGGPLPGIRAGKNKLDKNWGGRGIIGAKKKFDKLQEQ